MYDADDSIVHVKRVITVLWKESIIFELCQFVMKYKQMWSLNYSNK